jgi:hypothetical protein
MKEKIEKEKAVFLYKYDRAQQMMGGGGAPNFNEMMNNPEMMRM